MAINLHIIDEIIEILERDGILFEDCSEVGCCLSTSGQRRELIKHVKKHFKHFDYSIDCQSLSIPDEGNYYYYIFVWNILERLYPEDQFYKDAIKKNASLHYNVPKNKISFEFI